MVKFSDEDLERFFNGWPGLTKEEKIARLENLPLFEMVPELNKQDFIDYLNKE